MRNGGGRFSSHESRASLRFLSGKLQRKKPVQSSSDLPESSDSPRNDKRVFVRMKSVHLLSDVRRQLE